MSSYTNPNVITRDSRGERVVDVYSHLLSERIVYVGTGIDAGVANALITQFIGSPVATTCTGQAVAAGAVLLAAGSPGRRAALTHSRVVLYQPAAQGRGTIPDLILAAAEVVRVRSEMEGNTRRAHRPRRSEAPA